MAKAVTLKNNNNEEVYPVTDLSLVNGNIPTERIADSSITTSKIADGAVTSAKIDWTTLDGSEIGWKYVGEIRLTSDANAIDISIPSGFQNIKLIGGMSVGAGSNQTCSIKLMNGSSAIPSAWVVLDVVSDTGATVGTRDNYGSIAEITGVNQFDSLQIKLESLRSQSTEWRKYTAEHTLAGMTLKSRYYNGRCTNATQPTKIRVETTGRYGTGSFVKLWVS